MVAVNLKGVHRVRMKLAGGFAEYWYAWRGGPRILAEQAATKALLAAQVRRGGHLASLAYSRLTNAHKDAADKIAHEIIKIALSHAS